MKQQQNKEKPNLKLNKKKMQIRKNNFLKKQKKENKKPCKELWMPKLKKIKLEEDRPKLRKQ